MSMTAGNIVSMLTRQNPDISRIDLLDQVNFIHRLMTGERSELTKIIDPSTGIDYRITIPSASFDVGGIIIGVTVNHVDKLYSTHYNRPLQGVHAVGSTVKVPVSAVGDEYFVRMYRPANELLDESDEIDVSDEDIDVMIMGINAWIEQIQHGSVRSFQEWKARELKKWKWSKLNKTYNWDGGI